MVLLRIVVGLLLLAHGLVHLLYVAPDTPFTLDRSWIVPEGATRQVGNVLLGTTILAFLLVALAVWGVPGLSAIWPVLTIVAAGASSLMLLAYWNRQLVIGLAINAALVVAAIVRPDWVERLVG